MLAMALITSSCDFSKSVYKDLKTGMVTKGNGLSCDNVYLEVNDEKVSRNSYTYGERLFVIYENIEGFNRLEDLAFPGMQITVTDANGDTVLHSDDVYAHQTGGFDFKPLTLSSNVTLVDPIHSENEYTFHANIWDKKEPERTFSVRMDLSVVPDEKIEVESNQIGYDEVYLFSADRDLVLLDHMARTDENIYLNIEGLEGLTVENGSVQVGVSMIVKDANGEILINESDLTGDSWIDHSDMSSRFAPNFVISGEVSNPVSCEVILWDKQAEKSIRFLTLLRVE